MTGSGITRRDFISYSLRGLVLAGAGKGFYNTTSSQIETVKQKISLNDLPPAFKGLTIAQLSDLHASFVVSESLFTKAASLVMENRPDIIILTGDFVSDSAGSFNEEYLEGLVDALSGFEAPMGIYGVLGNHDFWSGKKTIDIICDKFTRAMGVTWLRNSHVKLEKDGASIDLLGVDDYWSHSYSLAKAYHGLDTDTVKILLSHNPDVNEDIIPQMRIDLVLSGHTHGGQIVMPVIGAPYIPSKFGQKYREGLVRDGARQTYVNRGIGHLLAPVRFNCPPEATIITLI